METTPGFDTSPTEKPAATPIRLNHWRIVANVFRALELFLALLLILWIYARLPLALRISFHYFRSALTFASRPVVVFVLSNAIIIAVVAKSGRLFAHNSNAAVDGFYDEIVKLNENGPRSRLTLDDDGEEEVVYQDKEVIVSEANALAPAACVEHESDFANSDYDSEEMEHPKAYFRRTRSGKFSKRRKWPGEEGAKALRRSETEKCRLGPISGGELQEIIEPEDELSSEEFQRKIEGFIAKELKFRREESVAIVLHSHRL
ncbi:uncharacterized protein LOC116211617 [Punica granatum]|uniref:Uncharacterized protein LOC116211617 n=1 Tax=Punica granatum TaxID=22663 RepID=A0A218WPT4_PUNGR|nr:uncharacterized protein LOC116211617 [Punica granatum]OWM74646.1 hypothetical protein CDL15_Pgr005226 [Punica granatum]